MSKGYIIAAIVAAVLAVGGFVYWYSMSGSPSYVAPVSNGAPVVTPPAPQTPAPTTGGGGY